MKDVYDIEMADPAHTFITESGLITSNCSHAYCVALDSLYGAWIKAHYPLAFYKAYLMVQNDKGDKDKMNAAKAEAEDYFGIHFPPFKFGQDNREITANPKTNEITHMTDMGYDGESAWCIISDDEKYMFQDYGTSPGVRGFSIFDLKSNKEVRRQELE